MPQNKGGLSVRLTLGAGVLYRILPTWDNKCGKYGQVHFTSLIEYVFAIPLFANLVTAEWHHVEFINTGFYPHQLKVLKLCVQIHVRP